MMVNSPSITINIAFYKGPPTLPERLIRWWTQSPYTHCEFVRSDGSSHSNDRYSLRSRITRIEFESTQWSLIPITLPPEIIEAIEHHQESKVGTHYDWIGIVFSQIFHLRWHDPKRWFCSKSVADDLRYGYRLLKARGGETIPFFEKRGIDQIHPQCYSPATLYQLLS